MAQKKYQCSLCGDLFETEDSAKRHIENPSIQEGPHKRYKRLLEAIQDRMNRLWNTPKINGLWSESTLARANSMLKLTEMTVPVTQFCMLKSITTSWVQLNFGTYLTMSGLLWIFQNRLSWRWWNGLWRKILGIRVFLVHRMCLSKNGVSVTLRKNPLGVILKSMSGTTTRVELLTECG